MVKGNADTEPPSASWRKNFNLNNSGFTHRESRSKEILLASQDLPYKRISTLSMEKSTLLPHSGSQCTYTLSFDAENRLIQIDYPGTNNYSSFVYDGVGRNVSIVETTAGSITNTKNFVWCGKDRCEQRDAGSSITAQFFAGGEIVGGSAYVYARDHLGSIREMTNSSGTVQAEYAFDPYGRVMEIIETTPSDLLYTGHYLHSRSGLTLAPCRQYSSTLGRWLSRDPLTADMTLNPYVYVDNSPARYFDPLGMKPGDPFDTPQAAAADALGIYGPKSKSGNKEYCGTLYKKDGKYYSTKANKGKLDNCTDPCPPPGSERVGDWHTHGDYSDENGNRTDKAHDVWDSDHFSRPDIWNHTIPYFQFWLDTPSGDVWVDIPGETNGPVNLGPLPISP